VTKGLIVVAKRFFVVSTPQNDKSCFVFLSDQSLSAIVSP
jgi:hypothetical protein